MKKIFRVFYSQIFNAFFPVIILLVLNKIIDKSGVSSVFLIINYSNFYLLFTDYSCNVIFLKEALQAGGITLNTHPSIIENINAYLSIKLLFLSIGFIIWIILCYFIPALHEHFLTNILSYTFIIGYNLNFYWVYMSSPKEFYFIVSNFLARLSLLILLLLFIFTKLNISWLMPVVGLLNIFICLIYFKKFCIKYFLRPKINNQTLKDAVSILKRDFNLMSSNFLLMTPTNCLYFFIGYVQNTNSIVIYGFAQQLFFGIRTLLSVFINSVYPGFCDNSISSKRKKQIFIAFYTTIILGCLTLFFLESHIANFLHFSNINIFISSLNYFILTLLILSVNVPFMLWGLLNNILYKKDTILYFTVASTIIVGVFAFNSAYYNSAINVAKSVCIAEAVLVFIFIISYLKTNKNLNNLNYH